MLSYIAQCMHVHLLNITSILYVENILGRMYGRGLVNIPSGG